MIGLGFLVALGPGMMILLALTVVWAFARRRSQVPKASGPTASKHARPTAEGSTRSAGYHPRSVNNPTRAGSRG
jgi:hypothetical protein